MSDKSKKQSRRQRQRRQQSMSKGIFIIAAVIAIAIAVYLVSTNPSVDRPTESVGVSVAQMSDSGHVETGIDVDYSTDPPTSGQHYGAPMPAGVYNAGDIIAPFPESNIVHSMEHGYVVFWYNCSSMSLAACEQLKSQIAAVLSKVGSQKVIVYPWNTIAESLVMTSWTQIQRFSTFDADLAADFVLANRSHPRAPEPNIP